MLVGWKHKKVWAIVSILRKLILPFAVSAITVLVLIIAIDFTKFRDALLSVDLTLLFIAALKVPLTFLILMLRWRQILEARGYKVSWRSLCAAVMVGCFFNNITPGLKTGGEPVRGYYLAKKHNLDFKLVMASIAVERMLQGIALATISLSVVLISLLFLRLPPSLTKPLLGVTIGFSAFIALVFYVGLFKFHWAKKGIEKILGLLRFIPRLRKSSIAERLTQGIEEFHNEYTSSLSDKPTIAAVLGLTAIQLGLDFLHPYIIFKALHVAVPVAFIMLSTTAVKLGGLFAITPGGSGIVEGVNFGFYAMLFSIPKESVVAQTLLSRGIDVWLMWVISGIAMCLVGQGL